MDKKATFIVFEGGEGSGKDTQIDLLKACNPKDTVFTREPGGTVIGERIRELVLSKGISDMAVRAELLLFLSARAQLIEEVIAPALRAGKNIVSNRFGLSTIAYQIYGRERHEYLSFLREVSNFVIGEYMPDHCVLLDVTPSVGIGRIQGRGDTKTRFDEEVLSFHERVREGYKTHVAEFGTPHIINADQPLAVVWKEVEATMVPLLFL